jgi:hypothetical protein
MKRFTLIEHKESAIVCEKSGLVSLSYNGLLTTPKVNIVVKLVVPTITIKSTLTCTNCGKTNHLVEICHKKKRKVLVVPTTTVKFIEPVVGLKPNLLNQEKYLFVISI